MPDNFTQESIEKLLIDIFYKGAYLLANQAAQEEIDSLKEIQLSLLEKLTMTPRWALLRTSFKLSQPALSLLAVAYLFQFEPDLFGFYSRVSWYERGPAISVKRALDLAIHDNEQDIGLQLLNPRSELIESQLLICSDFSCPMEQKIRVSEPVFYFLATASKVKTAFQPYYDTQGWLVKVVNSASPATAAVYKDLFAFPSANLNLVEVEQKQEAQAFIHSLLQEVQSKGVNIGDLWLVHTPLDEFAAAERLQQALLAAQLTNMPAVQAIYWPSFWRDCAMSSSLRVLAEFIIRTPSILLFCHPHNPVSDGAETLWMRECSKNRVSTYVLQASTEQLADGWLELCIAEGQPDAITKSEAQQLADRYPLISYQMTEVFNKVLKIGSDAINFMDLQQACLDSMNTETDGLATFCLPRISLSDMVLKDALKEQIEEILARMKYRRELEIQASGFLMGTQALFWGQPGTGKTMAAEAIAGELRLPLYKVNLSNIASKWIGETEKHLANLFDRAEKQQAVLLFDEADSIFAKRSEVESSQDKNANLGVSFLLQRMESYKGILLLSTNFKANIDDAFLRRFTAVSEFPLPDKMSRKSLWERVWKGNLKPAKEVNTEYLAAEFELSPSQIRNVAERACLFALMASETVITKATLAKSLRREFDKQSAGFLAAKNLTTWLNLKD